MTIRKKHKTALLWNARQLPAAIAHYWRQGRRDQALLAERMLAATRRELDRRGIKVGA